MLRDLNGFFMTIFTVAKLQNVGQKHVTLWGYVADPLIFVVNEQVWKSWKKEDQDAVRAAAEQAGKENIVLARKGISAGDESVIKEIEGFGVTVTRLSDADRKKFQAATKSVYDKWKGQIGNDLVAKAEAAVAKR